MKKDEKTKLEKLLNSYFKEVHKIYDESNFREETFCPAFKQLMELF